MGKVKMTTAANASTNNIKNQGNIALPDVRAWREIFPNTDKLARKPTSTDKSWIGNNQVEGRIAPNSQFGVVPFNHSK
jgi:hypothetical protein